jgi:peptidoglycan/xylan/chitin deacetylase (PgdA/CDA1 family)
LAAATFENGAGIIGEQPFRAHMQYLVDQQWQVVTTTQVIDWLTNGATLPQRCVALHFDNGWLDTATVALPILAELGFTATCFPITDGLEAASQGRLASVRTLTEGIIEKPFMTWEQAGRLLDAGWEIGAHTATHCKVADKHAAEGDEAIMIEAQTSNELFKTNLGRAPQHFAYPSGSRNPRTDELLARFYRSLRLWHFQWPIHWTFTDRDTSLLAVDCQNIDMRVSFDDFMRIFHEALAP